MKLQWIEECLDMSNFLRFFENIINLENKRIELEEREKICGIEAQQKYIEHQEKEAPNCKMLSPVIHRSVAFRTELMMHKKVDF